MSQASTPTSTETIASPMLRVDNVSKRYGDFSALTDVDLNVYSGKIHCLLGENGAGKSTLCKIIYGEELPSTGEMILDGQAYQPQSPADALASGLAMVHQHFSLINNMSVCENLMVGNVKGVLDPRAYAKKVVEVSERYGLQVDPFKRVSELSVGEQQRVEILKCLMRNPRLLILDEPTAVLLPDEIDMLLDTCMQIVREGHGIILVTHKLAEIAKVADEVTVLRAGKGVKHCEFSTDQVDSVISAMIGSDIKESAIGLSNLKASESEESQEHRSQPALLIDGLGYTDPKGNQKLADVTLVINRGEILGLAGVEGNGQSELGDIMAGLVSPTTGRFYLPKADLTNATPAQITEAGVAIVPENRHRVACINEMSLTENLLLSSFKSFKRFGLLDRKAMRNAAESLIQKFDVRAPSSDTKFGNLSGGNQQKAVLARELSINPLHFLLAAHPTRGLDIGAVYAVYEQIRQAADRGVGVLLISSELDDLITVCDKIAVIYRGRILGILPAESTYRDKIGAMMAGTATDTGQAA